MMPAPCGIAFKSRLPVPPAVAAAATWPRVKFKFFNPASPGPDALRPLPGPGFAASHSLSQWPLASGRGPPARAARGLPNHHDGTVRSVAHSLLSCFKCQHSDEHAAHSESFTMAASLPVPAASEPGGDLFSTTPAVAALAQAQLPHWQAE